ncbi:class-III pyridoxal-phosphate-dependent aminotransferase [Rhizobium rhizogenes]|uniref:class-III pyridoxal-phosphate-dependent aminotransferase n=1 Tax=Rhizobium rhizogenes TaxID=359 RepID=UPI00115D43A1|nr:aspartate aminotransferase family protein [Rhizobium rhizogenes]QCL10415.1 aminotransferase class-III family protein [Rhizobium rhizogenes]QCO89381.1 aminotransferase class-III family protein [Rhizobium rhizogenes]TRB17070.1 aspartate aminotransferase family protein [Rhizobium rhizogenes]
MDIISAIRDRQHEKYRLHEAYVNPFVSRLLLESGVSTDIVTAAGVQFTDREGRSYLDLNAASGVFLLGRNHPAIVQAIIAVASAGLPNLPKIDVSLLAGMLAERILSHIPHLDRVFFANSGAEATEAAMKFARAATGRNSFAFCQTGFHGLTFGALSLNASSLLKDAVGPFLGNCHAVPFNDLDALERLLASQQIAAFFVEPIQSNGIQMPLPNYLPEVQQLCKTYGTLLIADEIQTGLGRTGRFLASEHFGIKPDLVLLAKGLSGGFVPIGAVAVSAPVFDALFDRHDKRIIHGSTFARNDLAMAAGLATLAILDEEGLVARAARLGDLLIEGISAIIKPLGPAYRVRGRGMMIGVEMIDDHVKGNLIAPGRARQAFLELLREHAILCEDAGLERGLFILRPPLIISDQEIERVVAAFGKILEPQPVELKSAGVLR